MPAEGIFPAAAAVIGQSAKVAFDAVMPSIERSTGGSPGGAWGSSGGRGVVGVDALAVAGTPYEDFGGQGEWIILDGFRQGSSEFRLRPPRTGVGYLVIANLYLEADPGVLDPVVGFSTSISSVRYPSSDSSLVGGELNRAVVKGSGSASDAWTSSFVGVWSPTGTDELAISFVHSNTDDVRMLAAGNGVGSFVALVGLD